MSENKSETLPEDIERKALFARFQAENEKLGKVKFYQKIARELSKTARQKPPWSWRYIQGFHKQTIQPGRKFMEAVRTLIAKPPRHIKPAWIAEAANNLKTLLENKVQ